MQKGAASARRAAQTACKCAADLKMMEQCAAALVAPLNRKPPNTLRCHDHVAQQLDLARIEVRAKSFLALQPPNKHLGHCKSLFPRRRTDLLPHRDIKRPIRQAAPAVGAKAIGVMS